MKRIAAYLIRCAAFGVALLLAMPGGVDGEGLVHFGGNISLCNYNGEMHSYDCPKETDKCKQKYTFKIQPASGVKMKRLYDNAAQCVPNEDDCLAVTGNKDLAEACRPVIAP